MNFIKQKKKEISILIITIGVMGLICLLCYQPMMDIFKNPQVLRQQLQDLGIVGYLILALIMALQVVFVFLPGEIIEIMAGFLYGPIGGMLACLIGSAVGSILIFVFVQKFGIKFIDQLIGKDKINEVHLLKDKEKRNILLFIIFLIPGTPKDILTYLMPLTDIKLSTFLFITTLARIPSIITSTIGGHAIGTENYIFSIIVFGITGFISIIGIFIYKKMNEKKCISYHL
ncbi:MAG: VTT domain-containing protein [Coprobacillus sp.]